MVASKLKKRQVNQTCGETTKRKDDTQAMTKEEKSKKIYSRR